jgi:hypothetical protein
MGTKAGMARLGTVVIDSTRIKANASPDRLQQQDQRQVRRWRQEMESDDTDQEPGTEVSAERAARLRQQMATAVKSPAAGKRSRTDSDARFLRERGGKFTVRLMQNATDNASLLY